MTTPDHFSTDGARLAPGECRVLLSVEHRLRRSGYTALSRVFCEFERESGVLHLHGAVASHYLKQVAQELVVDLEGVRLLDNQISVGRPARCGAARDGECPDHPDASSGT